MDCPTSHSQDWACSALSGVGEGMVSQAKPLESTPRNLNLEGSDPETEKSWYRFMAKAERTVINVGP